MGASLGYGGGLWARLADRLPQPEEVALAVAEPGPPLSGPLARIVARDLGDAVDRREPRQVDLLEDHAATPELRGRRLDVVHLEPHLREARRRLTGRREQGELAARAPIEEPALALLARLEPELLRVEP